MAACPRSRARRSARSRAHAERRTHLGVSAARLAANCDGIDAACDRAPPMLGEPDQLVVETHDLAQCRGQCRQFTGSRGDVEHAFDDRAALGLELGCDAPLAALDFLAQRLRTLEQLAEVRGSLGCDFARGGNHGAGTPAFATAGPPGRASAAMPSQPSLTLRIRPATSSSPRASFSALALNSRTTMYVYRLWRLAATSPPCT